MQAERQITVTLIDYSMQSQIYPRVLLLAEVANPEWRSIPLEGWTHSRGIAALTDAHVVTRLGNRSAFLRAGLVEGKDFTALDTMRMRKLVLQLQSWLRGGAGKGWTTATALDGLSYYHFETMVWQELGQQIVDGKFDIVHRITPSTPTTPSLLAQKCHQVGVPFVIGPLNGGLPWPKGFNDVRHQEKEWLSYVRWMYKLLPGYRSTRRDAAAIIIGSQATWEQMPARYRDKCVYMPANAIAPERFVLQRAHETTRPLKAIFVGRLVPYKGPDMLIEAAAPLVRDGALRLEIVGDGPEMPKLKALVAKEGIENGVELVGQIPHTSIQERLSKADIFAFPSIREFGGAVVIEAMAVGLVPIVVNYGGPGEMVTASTGYTVPMGSRSQIVAGFREILSQLAADPSSITEMGQRARNRALKLFTREARARQVLEVYRWVLGDGSDKPDFGMPLADVE